MNAAKFSIPFDRGTRQLQTWWFPEVKDAVSQTQKAFAALIEVMKIVRLTFLSRDLSHLSSSGQRLRHGRRHACLSLSKIVYSLRRSVAGISSPCFSPNFPHCSFPTESASVYADYLKYHFSVSQPKVLRNRARGYLSELLLITCSEESH